MPDEIVVERLVVPAKSERDADQGRRHRLSAQVGLVARLALSDIDGLAALGLRIGVDAVTHGTRLCIRREHDARSNQRHARHGDERAGMRLDHPTAAVSDSPSR